MRIKNRVMRQLAVMLLSACMVILPMSAHALGFGNIRIKSALNEPLDAEIELLSATKSDLKGLKIQLASREAFLRAGIERPGHLSQLKFSIQTRSNGRSYLKISTKQSVREPFLDFLLEMNWKNGRMLREYTVLLDPPDRMRQQPTLVESPQTESPAVVAKQEEQTPVEEQASPFVEQEPVLVEEPQAEAPVEIAEEPIVEESIAVAEVEPEPVPLAETVPDEDILPVEEPQAAIIPEAELAVEPEAEEDVAEPDPFAGEKFPRIPIKTDKRLRKAEEAELAKIDVEPAPEPIIEEASAPSIAAEEPLQEPLAEEPLAPAEEPQPELLADETPVSEEPYSQESEPADSVKTKRNDNLWNIAKSMQPDESVSIYQVMMALLQSNPDAFVDGNVHRLKVGKVLRIEDPSMLTTMSRSQAAQEYIAQTQAWEDYRNQFAVAAGGASDSTSMQSESVSEPAVIEQQPVESEPASGELVLAAPEGENQSAGAAGDQQETVNNEVVILREEIRQALAEAEAEGNKNIILNEKLRDLEAQLQDLQRSVVVKDDELATLQKQLSDVNKRNIEAEQTAVAEQQAEAPVHSEIPEVNTQQEAEAPAVMSEEQMLAQQEQAAQETTETPVVTPAPVANDKGFMDGVMKTISNITSSLPVSPTILAIGGGVIVVLLLLMLLLMQRRRQAANFQESILSGIPSHEVMASEEASIETNLSGESSFLSDFAISGASALQGDDGDVDPLTEADVFMAYGRYEAAEERIKEAIKTDPDRKELRIKLLELYNTTKNKAAFEEAAEEMYTNIGNDASNPLWQKVVVMGAMLAPENPLFTDSGDVTRIRNNEDATRIRNMPGDDTNSEILDLGMSDDFDSPATTAGSDDLQMDDLGLDLDFAADDSNEAEQSLNFDIESTAGDEDKTGELPDLDFNLADSDQSAQVDVSGLDFELPMDNTDEVDLGDLSGAQEETAETEVALSLDMESGEKDTAQFSLDESLELDQLSEDLSGLDMDLSNESSMGLTLDMDMDATGETVMTEQANDGLTMEMAQPTVNEMEVPTMEAELDATDMADLDTPSIMDEVGTKLDLAKAYIDMGDPDGARSILDEVLEEGTPPQQQEAQELMQQI